MFPWTDEEIKEMIDYAPRSTASSARLGTDASDISLVERDKESLYRVIGTALLEHRGWVLVVRVYPEQVKETDRWYARLQFCKPENLKRI